MPCRKLRRELLGVSKWRRGLLLATGVVAILLLLVYYEEAVTTETSSSANGRDELTALQEDWKPTVERVPALSLVEVARRFDGGRPIKRTKKTTHKKTKNNARTKRNESQTPTKTRDKKRRYLERKSAFCGPVEWKERYKKLHREILLGKRTPRFLVYYCGGEGYGCGGYGNRMGAIASLFFLAVLTNRAFLIEWNYTPINIQDYFQPKNIHWNFTLKGDARRLSERTHYWGAGYPRKLTENITRPFPDDQLKFGEWLQRTDLSKYLNRSVEKLTSMWYFSERIWKNKYMVDRMHRLVTKKARSKFSLVGCAFDFLFQLTPRLESLLSKARTATGINSHVPSIGIHIRMGDVSFGRPVSRKGAIISKDYKAFFACAKKYENAIARANPKLAQNEIKWFVTSDDPVVKRYAMREFKEKVVVLFNKVEHIAMFRKKRNSPSDDGMIGVLLDHFVLSECDYLVVSKSSFSYTALGLTFHKQDEYTHGEQCRVP